MGDGRERPQAGCHRAAGASPPGPGDREEQRPTGGREQGCTPTLSITGALPGGRSSAPSRTLGSEGRRKSQRSGRCWPVEMGLVCPVLSQTYSYESPADLGVSPGVATAQWCGRGQVTSPPAACPERSGLPGSFQRREAGVCRKHLRGPRDHPHLSEPGPLRGNRCGCQGLWGGRPAPPPRLASSLGARTAGFGN